MVAISVGPDAIKQSALRRDVPVTEGLEFGTERQEGNISNLIIHQKINESFIKKFNIGHWEKISNKYLNIITYNHTALLGRQAYTHS